MLDVGTGSGILAIAAARLGAKGIVAVDAAYQAVDFALAGIAIGKTHGINGQSAEQTMRNIGRIASPGMVETEDVILNIMREK